MGQRNSTIDATDKARLKCIAVGIELLIHYRVSYKIFSWGGGGGVGNMSVDKAI